MEWTPIQKKAMDDVKAWMSDPSKQVFHLFGYAGTGKTTIVKEIAKIIDGTVIFGAFTGKAALVLNQKGCQGATTIHSMIYRTSGNSKQLLESLRGDLDKLKAKSDSSASAIKSLEHKIKEAEKKAQQPFFTLNPESMVKQAKLVIIDECSMVGRKLAEDLMSFGTKILVIGDPAQLPPVKATGFFTKDITPEILLEEIHRQAEGSPILKLATLARTKQPIPLGEYGKGCKVVTKQRIEDPLKYDQILVGTNKTRHHINKRCREALGRASEYPEIGDKVVCLKNNHEAGLLNGALFEIVKVAPQADEGVIKMTVRAEDSEHEQDVKVFDDPFYGAGVPVDGWGNNIEEFAYGYALTVHKSQGSQWNNVLLIDESYKFRGSKKEWLYTGITRAAEQLTIMK